MPTLSINGKEVTVDKGATVIQAAEKLGLDVPRYCYHPGLSVSGNCRMCLVEVEKTPKLQISCHLQAADGMVVRTESDVVKQTRQHILEFLLINHPVDCPVCDQAGECFLQDYYMQHGLYDSRLNENKVKKHKAVPIGPTVMLDSERCILCSRCVRFTDEITKTHEFGIFNRGDHSEVGLYPGRELSNKYSGNVVDICPVGALTDRDFRFKCRVWYLKSTPSVCTGCSMGCNINVHYQIGRSHIAGGDRVMRLKPRVNEDVNKWWMCDEGRYDYKFIDKDRIVQPAFRANGRTDAGLRTALPSGWPEVLEKVDYQFQQIPKEKWAVLASPQLTNEELYLIKKLFVESLGVKVYVISPKPEGFSDDLLMKADKNPNTRGAFELGLNTAPGQLDEFMKQLKAGQIEGLYLFGQDLTKILPAETANLALACKYVIYQGSNWNQTAEFANVVLPSAVYAEKNGTLTNFQRRVQRIFKAFDPKGASRPDCEIIMELAKLRKVALNFKESKQIFDEIAAKVPVFKGMSYQTLGKKGAVLA